MRICDLHSSTIRLTRAAKDLREQWNATSEYWKDKNRDDFDSKYVQPIGPQISLLLAAVNSLSDVFARAERELEDRKSED
ncbi:MAG: hypothetical protein H6821_13995 [Planctomycetaceae bacterium]|nr:hypothetical protein [Planctomycetales bacterium]MCB9875282.1 hypothetical protein [Planctomycetaceae bacterium]MCB9938934.1 hypothetical protein [Planctomycetaceae bacterium]